MNSCGRFLVIRVAAIALLGAAVAARADDFAGARMADGIEAYRSGQFAEASNQFRIACFDLLDQPVRLSEGLMRLALAQEAVGRKADVTATLKRFLDVERRFAGYAGARVDVGLRSEFEGLLRSRMPADALAAVPSLSRPPAQVAEQAPVVEKARAEKVSASEIRIEDLPANDRNVGSPAVSPPEAAPPVVAPPVVAPPEAAPLVVASPVVASPAVTPPVALETPAPAYPDLARRARVEGDVLVEAMIGADGSVREVRVLRSASLLLEPAALEAVRRWRYRPARVGDRPVATSIRVVVTFSRRSQKARQAP